MNNSLESEIAELSAALRVAIASQHRPGSRLFSEPETYSYFRALSPLKKEAPQAQRIAPRPATPPPTPAVTAPVAVTAPPIEPKPAPEKKAPEEKKAPATNEPFSLHPPAAIVPDDFEAIRKQIHKIAPEVKLHDTIPSDSIADEVNKLAASPQVVIIAADESAGVLAFLQNMAEGIGTKLGVTVVVSPQDPLTKDLDVRVFLITPAAAKAVPELIERANVMLLHQLPDLVAGDRTAKLKVWTALQGFLR